VLVCIPSREQVPVEREEKKREEEERGEDTLHCELPLD